jgi:hypothetical protein
MKNRIYIFILVCVFLSSCSYFTFYPQTGSISQPATNPKDIKIFTGDIDRPYTVLGSVSANTINGNEEENLKPYLSKQAAKIGADAIIFAEVSVMGSANARVGLSGVAIRYKN